MSCLAEATAFLQRYWGYPRLYPFQEKVISAIWQGEDVLALLPTGGGKSLCYQLPAFLGRGVTLVVSPLVALMQDQVERLRKLGLPAACLHQGIDAAAREKIWRDCQQGQLKLLYVAPERLTSASFRARCQELHVSLLAVDEAHCLVEWGYDFRPDYLKLAALRPLLGSPPILALTATATPAVREEIIQRLDMRDCKTFLESFSRSNLFFTARQVEDLLQETASLLHCIQGSAIVYLPTRREVEEMATFLQGRGFSAIAYHAGMQNEARARHQQEWVDGRKRVMVATKAFGMGIDKPDVRLVVHAGTPSSLEAYYQEAGRAGRDGEQAHAVFLYREADLFAAQKRLRLHYPSVAALVEVWEQLYEYIAAEDTGEGEAGRGRLDLYDFADHIGYLSGAARRNIGLLGELGVCQYTMEAEACYRIAFSRDRSALYTYQLSHALADRIIQAMVVLYDIGPFEQLTAISMDGIAKLAQCGREEVISVCERLQEVGLAEWHVPACKPAIQVTAPARWRAHSLLPRASYEARRQAALDRQEAVFHYLRHPAQCRAQLLLDYLGEVCEQPCQSCDRCVEGGLFLEHFFGQEKKDYKKHILALLVDQAYLPGTLPERVCPGQPRAVLSLLQEMIEEGTIFHDQAMYLEALLPEGS